VPAPTTRSVLQTLSRARLAELAQGLAVLVPPGATRDQQADAVAGAGRLRFRELVESLGRDELRVACRAHGLDDTGRARPALAARLLQAHGAQESAPPPPLFTAHEAPRYAPRAGELSSWGESWFKHHVAREAILTRAPLPAELPDGFEDNYLACVRDEMAYENDRVHRARRELYDMAPNIAWNDLSPAQIAEARFSLVTRRSYHWRQVASALSPFLTLRTAAERLLTRPLTPPRATAIARLLKKEAPELLKHDRIVEVAQLAEPLATENLPPEHTVDLDSEKQVEAYRLLGGRAADERLRAILHEETDKPELSPQMHPLDPYRPWLEPLFDDALRDKYRRRAEAAPLVSLLHFRTLIPWIADKHTVCRVAERDLDDELGWSIGELPPELWSLVRERARRTRDEDEAAYLIDWLGRHGLPREGQADVLLARIDAGLAKDPIVLALWLDTPAAWESIGARLLRALARKDRWQLLLDLWSRLLHVRRRHQDADQASGADEPPTPDEEAAVLTKAHVIFAAVLVDLAEEAVSATDEDRLRALLDALQHLDPSPIEIARLRALGALGATTERSRERIEATATLLEESVRSPTASREALIEATKLAHRDTTPAEPEEGDR
jgi:hypothetical protein